MAYTTHKDAKEAGWFSRRHKSADAHVAARFAFLARSGREARIARAQERLDK